MIVKPDDSLASVWQNILSKLAECNSFSDPGFRTAVLSSVNENSPESRMVMIRGFDAEMVTVNFYTDARSQKVIQIRNSPQVAVLLYDSENRIQFILKGKAAVHLGDETASEAWSKVPEMSRSAYGTILPPGTPVEKPSEGHSWPDQISDEYFAVVVIEIAVIELLQLGDKGHMRVEFEKSNGWNGRWTVS